MQFWVDGLADDPLAAAAAFHTDVLPQIEAALGPGRIGKVARSADGADSPRPPTSLEEESALHHPSGDPPSHGADDTCLILIFDPCDHTHRAWRVAAVQSLARKYAPTRVNAVASDDDTAIAAATRYLAAAPGVTGQYLPLDGTGAWNSLS